MGLFIYYFLSIKILIAFSTSSEITPPCVFPCLSIMYFMKSSHSFEWVLFVFLHSAITSLLLFGARAGRQTSIHRSAF